MTLELACLALAVYFEARSEPWEGQLAVAQVVMQRVEDSRFPGTVCDVVYHGGEKPRFRCQFSWYCDGRPDTPYNTEAWEYAQIVASAALDGTRIAGMEGALWYHATWIDPPWWAWNLCPVKTIGKHTFYAARSEVNCSSS